MVSEYADKDELDEAMYQGDVDGILGYYCGGALRMREYVIVKKMKPHVIGIAACLQSLDPADYSTIDECDQEVAASTELDPFVQCMRAEVSKLANQRNGTRGAKHF